MAAHDSEGSMHIRSILAAFCVAASAVALAACSGAEAPATEPTATEGLALSATADPSAQPAPSTAPTVAPAPAPKDASLADAPPPYCTQNCVCCTSTDGDGGIRPPYFWTTPDWCRANGYTINNYTKDYCFD
jgi:hypothetical protein